MKNNLKQYQTIKTNLLKEWSEKDFERINKHILYILKANLSHNTIIEHGHEEKTIDYTSEHRLGDVFGLPYTSSGDFAAVWNTNTQTVPTTTQKKRKAHTESTLKAFRGVASVGRAKK